MLWTTTLFDALRLSPDGSAIENGSPASGVVARTARVHGPAHCDLAGSVELRADRLVAGPGGDVVGDQQLLRRPRSRREADRVER